MIDLTKNRVSFDVSGTEVSSSVNGRLMLRSPVRNTDDIESPNFSGISIQDAGSGTGPGFDQRSEDVSSLGTTADRAPLLRHIK